MFIKISPYQLITEFFWQTLLTTWVPCAQASSGTCCDRRAAWPRDQSSLWLRWRQVVWESWGESGRTRRWLAVLWSSEDTELTIKGLHKYKHGGQIAQKIDHIPVFSRRNGYIFKAWNFNYQIPVFFIFSRLSTNPGRGHWNDVAYDTPCYNGVTRHHIWPALPKWGISRGMSSPANRRQSPSMMILHWNVDCYVFAICIN